LIAADPSTHGAMFVPVIAGSDKTAVSVATGHQEYHPVYMSPGNLSNVARRAHGNAFLPVAFLPIPKSECWYFCDDQNLTETWQSTSCLYKIPVPLPLSSLPY